MSAAEMIAEARIMRGTAEGIQKAAEEAEDAAEKAILSPEDAARELRVARLLIDYCQKLVADVGSIWDRIRRFIRAGELGEKDLLTTARIFKRFFDSGEFAFTSVRGLIHFLQSHQLSPSGVAEFEAAASCLAAVRDDFTECYANLKDPTPASTVADRFQALASRWKRDTRFCSSRTKMVDHPAYKEIVGMGPAAIPLLIEELRTDPRYWFPALHAITGEDPVPAEDRGSVRKMADAWLQWGQAHGF